VAGNDGFGFGHNWDIWFGKSSKILESRQNKSATKVILTSAAVGF
jgi:hypothetical protein